MDYLDLADEYIEYALKLRRMEYEKSLSRFARGEMLILAYLAPRSGEVRPGQLSLDMGISTARTAATLNSMEDKGWIYREHSSEDRRGISVSITDEGRRISQKLRENLLSATAEILRSLGEEDAAHFVRITKKLADNNK